MIYITFYGTIWSFGYTKKLSIEIKLNAYLLSSLFVVKSIKSKNVNVICFSRGVLTKLTGYFFHDKGLLS